VRMSLGHGAENGSDVATSWKRLKVVGKMRRQKRETMGQDVLSGASFIGVARDSVTIHFLRKMCLSISTTCAIRTRC
jgi:hypothetical protein